jgi:hypothetical protein
VLLEPKVQGVCNERILPAALTAHKVAVAACKAAVRVLGSSAASAKPLLAVTKGGGFDKIAAKLPRPSPEEKEQLASARSASECMAVLLAYAELQRLPWALDLMGRQFCLSVPVPSCCNNPHCTNMSGASELQLVQGRAAKCKAFGTARYAYDMQICLCPRVGLYLFECCCIVRHCLRQMKGCPSCTAPGANVIQCLVPA